MTRFATAIILVALVLAFQNCSNARFIQSMTGISGKGLGPAAVVGLSGNPTGVTTGPALTVPTSPAGVADLTVAAALAECDALAAQAATLPLVPTNTAVIDSRGNLDFRGDSIDLFESNRGTFRILGMGPAPIIGAVVGNAGNLLICGMDVRQIGNSNGNILIVRGSVGDVVNFSGNIKLVGGRVLGTQTNVSGTITEL